MNRSYGFSLAEVLVSLLLVSTTALALQTQQWRASQWFNAIHDAAQQRMKQDNGYERAGGA